MKWLLLFALALSALCTAVQAANPHEELKRLTAKLQQSPSDAALREEIIRLARTMKPVPAIPEEARQKFVEGATITKSANNASGQALAVQRFQDVLKIAPWWGDAYYNLAIAQELAGQFDAAQGSLKFYILTDPGKKETRDAQDRIYALNAKKDLAAAQQAAKRDADREALMRSLDGATFREEWSLPSDRGGMVVTQVFTVRISGRQVTYSTWMPINPAAGTSTYTCELNGPSCDLGTGNARFRQTLSFSSDGRTVKSAEYFDGALSREVTMTRQNR